MEIEINFGMVFVRLRIVEYSLDCEVYRRGKIYLFSNKKCIGMSEKLENILQNKIYVSIKVLYVKFREKKKTN